MDFGRAGFDCLLFEAIEFFTALADIAADRNDLAAVVFLSQGMMMEVSRPPE